jgi:gas vesicle protein
MSEFVIIGIFTCVGTALGVFASFVTTLFLNKRDKEVKTLKENVEKLTNQVVSYWNLEKKYSEELSKLNSKNSKTVLQEFRDAIEDAGYERPTMTEHGAKKFVK